MTNRTSRLALAALFLAVIWPGQGSATMMYNELVVLGDSLSDQGNIYTITGSFVPPLEYTDGTHSGRFTNGLNYIDYLAPRLGLTVTPSELGGTNYAYGGARTDSHPQAMVGALSLLQQRDAYLSDLGGMNANPDALHIVWAGSNDLRDIINAVLMDSTINPVPLVLNSVANVAEVVGSLAAVNSSTIVVPNIPNIGIVPIVTGGGPPVQQATDLAVLFNMTLDLALAGVLAQFPLLNLIPFDVFALSTELFQNPAGFGFTNVTNACYSLFVETGGTVCTDPDAYVSWDGFHPTTAAHEAFAAEMAQAVPEPATLSLLIFGLAGLGVARHRIMA